MATKIYYLKDPRDDRMRYVGKTIRELNVRLTSHMNETGQYPKARWIAKLKLLGLKPTIHLIEEVEGNGNEAERFYIKEFRALGFADLNATDGGDGMTSEAAYALAQKLGPEGCKAKAVKAQIKYNREKHQQATRKAKETMGVEGRRIAYAKRNLKLGIEGLQANARKAMRTMGPEGLSERGRKVNAVRRAKNGKTAPYGVNFHRGQNRWHAALRFEGNTIHVGTYKTMEEAIDAQQQYRDWYW